jgi:hypothetical protein
MRSGRATELRSELGRNDSRKGKGPLANSEPKSRSRPYVRRFDDSRIGGDLSLHQGVKLSRIYRHRVDAQSRQFLPHITRLQWKVSW